MDEELPEDPTPPASPPELRATDGVDASPGSDARPGSEAPSGSDARPGMPDAVDRTPQPIDIDVRVEEAEPDELPSFGEASEVPAPFFWALWVAVFAVILWGMLLLFRGRPPDRD